MILRLLLHISSRLQRSVWYLLIIFSPLLHICGRLQTTRVVFSPLQNQ